MILPNQGVAVHFKDYIRQLKTIKGNSINRKHSALYFSKIRMKSKEGTASLVFI